MTEEFQQRFAGRYFGKYRGIVADIDDPLKLYRIMVKVPVVLGPDEVIGWAYPAKDKSGGSQRGSTYSPQVNDFVWIEFEEGDPQRPVWSGGPWGKRDNVSMVPKHAQGLQDTIDNLLRNIGNIPASSFAGEYPSVHVNQSWSGHIFEFDDTDGKTRVQLAHNTGSRVEMLHDGSVEFVSAEDMRHYVAAAYSREVEGNETILVKGNAIHESEGSFTLKSSGGEIGLNPGSAPGISLGGSSATDSFLKGEILNGILDTFLASIAAHVHPAPGGTTSPPVDAPTYLALKAQLPNAISQYIKGR